MLHHMWCWRWWWDGCLGLAESAGHRGSWGSGREGVVVVSGPVALVDMCTYVSVDSVSFVYDIHQGFRPVI